MLCEVFHKCTMKTQHRHFRDGFLSSTHFIDDSHSVKISEIESAYIKMTTCVMGIICRSYMISATCLWLLSRWIYFISEGNSEQEAKTFNWLVSNRLRRITWDGEWNKKKVERNKRIVCVGACVCKKEREIDSIKNTQKRKIWNHYSKAQGKQKTSTMRRYPIGTVLKMLDWINGFGLDTARRKINEYINALEMVVVDEQMPYLCLGYFP